ncbi:aminotransferase class I/II-fold pyridoxal phosphate-dependent enzyme [Paeniclostridium sordellii]|uniref:DegT/DnrJ/EryC1/StrS family aminotransferase n=1 Tax=Paraclostridium sordellii TaxID=1505 RepID=UPI0005E3D07E|nr:MULTISPECIES: DegT/DnrJ/EryC1/StrS family aminotransferase [Paeniclostridium]MBW4863512.1 DegT/DnrJ/EryC1/StrS family aminotransferase [Paeniclostridium sp.]MBW4873166.1 DegT/DnrJ/EryC1/StrS family aminotransferase [Paeniclostridium sp.]MVO75263.1 aminotransferase class I/II-fold pyridoxal phosphate-dependent enzyme [Paeniclostridium sordellii]CEN94104.1 aminotransferase [[Clostridium] sordellii] [Paeniclostridium sordellii]CEN96105.1 aminotransferase [[Clostridium] sordellii] [Paeniclostri
MNIPFSPPDITEVEINNVVEVLKSGWITTGPKTKEFEKKIANYCNTNKAICLNSATAGMEMTLRFLGIGPGDEVITSAYTYTASASVIHHVGAKIVLVDTAKDSYQMDYDKLAGAITEKTKAVICVDLAGVPCDYDKIFELVNSKKELFNPNNEIQKSIGRVTVVADGAHSFGANYKGKMSGSIADFTSFSFHAVKNLTTAEGGAVTWKSIDGIDDEEIYKRYNCLSLHGQTKDALAKTKIGSWEYDIIEPAYKCNMTDIMAAIGLGQLSRYEDLLNYRKEIINRYDELLKEIEGVDTLKHFTEEYTSSGHLYLIRLIGKDSEFRNKVIVKMAEKGIATNVHYKPLPLLTAYKNLGFDINDYPNAFNMYKNEITLPLNTCIDKNDVEYIVGNLSEILCK